MKIVIWASVGRGSHKETIEVEDGLTEDELEEVASEAAIGLVESGWYRADKGDDKVGT